MADNPASERTEQPTPHRLKKARSEGQVPTSQEVPTALTVAMLLVVLSLAGGGLLRWFAAQVRHGASLGADSGAPVEALLAAKGLSAIEAIVPFLVSGVAVSILASLVASGWALAPKAVGLRFDRINPVKGFKQLFSLASIFRLLVSLTKAAVIIIIVYTYLRDKLGACMALRWAAPMTMVTGISRLVLGAAGRIAVALLAIALADLLFQRWRYKRDLRMTRQEVKQERRQYEVSPEVRTRIRTVQIEMVRRRMLQEVPKADVVVANPTHVAVALKYDAAAMAAPQVVAKGPELLCEKIKEIARAHGVPVVYRAELARALYAAVDVGKFVPEALFVAVAEVLAMIYRLRRNRPGMAPLATS